MFYQLGAEDLVVQFTVATQLLVGAAGGDPALVKNQDEIRVPHGTYPPGDYENRAVSLAHEPIQVLP